MDLDDARSILGVPPSATAGAVAASFRQRALDVHPDAGGDPAEFALLLAARDALLAAGSRRPEPLLVTSRRRRRQQAIGRLARPILLRLGLRAPRVR